MLLILSAEWAEAGIEANYGRMPVGFLPFGPERLFRAQRNIVPCCFCAMTIPDDFLVPDYDRRELESQGIRLLPQPVGLSPCAMIADALRRVAPKGSVHIALGNAYVTLPEGAAGLQDWVAVTDISSRPGALNFDPQAIRGARFSTSSTTVTTGQGLTACGYFCIVDAELLADACRGANLPDALNKYDACLPLSAVIADRSARFDSMDSYASAKSQRLVKRAFNEVSRSGATLVKRSADFRKMEAEARWYETLPDELRPYAPRYLGRDNAGLLAGYALEFLDLPAVSELSAFGGLPGSVWETIIGCGFELLRKLQEIRPPRGSPYGSSEFCHAFHQSMIVDKTRSRLEQYRADGGTEAGAAITVNGTHYPPVPDVVERLIGMVRPTRPDDIRFWHGDYYYGNLLFDRAARRIFCIDPRGNLENGTPTSFGDRRYDVAKLAHSVIGHYDRIVLGEARLDRDGPFSWRFAVKEQPDDVAIEARFFEMCRADLKLAETDFLPLTALLFFAMLPLHGDRPDLQRMFLASGLIIARRVGLSA